MERRGRPKRPPRHADPHHDDERDRTMPNRGPASQAGADEWDELLSRIMQAQQALDEATTHLRLAEAALMAEAATGRNEPLMLAWTCLDLQSMLRDAGGNVEDLDIEQATAAEHLSAAADVLDAIAASDRPADLVLVRARLQGLRAQVAATADPA